MVEYNKVSVKLSDTQLKKLKAAVKNKTGTTLKMSLTMLDGNDLSHELLLTTRQNTKLRNAFNENMSTYLKYFKAQNSKVLQSGGLFRTILSTLAGPLIKVAIPLAKNVLAPLRITAAGSAIDAGIQKKMNGSETITLIISNVSNEEMNDLMKIVETLDDSNILSRRVTRTIKNETKEQKGGFLSTFLGTLGGSALGNLITGKGVVRPRSGKGIVRAGYGKE